MKKLLLILLCPILLLTSCSKSGVTPQSLEGVIVGKKWILNNDVNGFYLSQNGGFYSTEMCGEDVQQGNWIIEDDLIKYRYYLNSQEVTILYGQVSEYTSTQIKLVYYSDPTTTVNLIYNAFTEIYGCTDATADNYNENANCDDGSCGYCINNDCSYVPDDNFEQHLINEGYDNLLDDYVITSNINTVTFLDLSDKNISDLTGIEDFTALTELVCWENQLTNLDVSQNTALIELRCSFNQLTSLDLSNNTALTFLGCSFNHLTSLDVSTNTALTSLSCAYNQLTSLDVRNGNNTALTFTQFQENYNLYCIDVDDANWSTSNWTSNIDPQHYFSEDCSAK